MGSLSPNTIIAEEKWKVGSLDSLFKEAMVFKVGPCFLSLLFSTDFYSTFEFWRFKFSVVRGLSFGLSFLILWGWGWFPHRQLLPFKVRSIPMPLKTMRYKHSVPTKLGVSVSSLVVGTDRISLRERTP